MNENQDVVFPFHRFVDYIFDNPRFVAMLGEHQGRSLIAHLIEDISRPL
jgi:hypothetical protein